MKKFIKEHLIQIWVIASIVFAILIHILFVTDAPCDKLQAQWGAGDILTYASTVALGLLAVWQNQKFKEENDKSQERLEKLNIQANELAVISKIIDNKSQKLEHLYKYFYEYESACSIGELTAICISDSHPSAVVTELVRQTQKISTLKNALIAEICGNIGVEPDPICEAIRQLYSVVSDVMNQYVDIVCYKDEHRLKCIEDTLVTNQKYSTAYDAFCKERNIYILKTERLLNYISYEDIPLQEIREYIKESSKEDSPNEQQTSPSNPQPDSPEH